MSTHPEAASETRGARRVDEDLPGGPIVMHWRVDPGGRVLRALALGALVITVGAMAFASALALASGAREATVEGPMVLRRSFLSGQVVDEHGEPLARRPVRGEEVGLGLFGLLLVALGGAVVLVGLKKELRSDTYLALRTDGALFRDGARVEAVRWDEVEAVRWDARARAVQFILHDGGVWSRREGLAGVGGEELAKRAAEVRRKALFGLYR